MPLRFKACLEREIEFNFEEKKGELFVEIYCNAFEEE